MLAHVDHGKSALSDALISSNGIINPRLAGQVRYLDSRADEQRRGITMKSSSIALGSRSGGDPSSPLRLVNLVDSPGHIDFTGEVGAALRVCDGAIVVIDVVEGVCVQTIGVLRAALEHAVRPVLVLNKLDRLFVELQLGPMEAYWHIQRVIGQVNVIMGVRQVEDMMARADLHHDQFSARTDEPPANGGGGGDGDGDGNGDSGWRFDPGEDDADSNVSGYFSPERGNVAFASAVDGWAFRLDEFAALFSSKFGISQSVLRKTLWGNYYLHAKSKKIVRKRVATNTANPAPSAGKPMFVQFILSSLHSVYDSLYSTQNDFDLAVEKRAKIVDRLNLSLPARDLRHKDATIALRAIMAAWLPAAPALMNLILDCLPSAADAQLDPARRAVLWPHLETKGESALLQQRAIEKADSSDDAPVMAYVTKMLEPVDSSSASGGRINIRRPKARPSDVRRPKLDSEHQKATPSCADSAEAPENRDIETPGPPGLIAFARLVSGTLSVGDRVWVYGPRYVVTEGDGSYDEATVAEAEVTSLFLLMGRDMESVSLAVAGSVVGIGGLSDTVLKTATISSLPPGKCLPLGSLAHSSSVGNANNAVVRVAVEPHLPGDVPHLQKGLRRLNQADPAVDTYVTSMGEHVIAASGELHLERCLLDLRERFAAGIQIHVSAPIVSFRESVLGGPSSDPISTFLDGYKQSFSPSASSMTAKSNDITSSVTGPVATGAGGADVGASEESGTSPGVGRARLGPTVGWSVTLEGVETQSGPHLPPMTGYTTGLMQEVMASPFIRRGRFAIVGNSVFSFRLSAAPIPARLATVLDEAGMALRATSLSKLEEASVVSSRIDDLRDKILEALKEDAESASIRQNLKGEFVDFWRSDVLGRIWSSGPRQFGSTLLVGCAPSKNLTPWMGRLFEAERSISEGGPLADVPEGIMKEFESAIVTGFQLAAQSGPLCEEPMHGLAFFVDVVQSNIDSAGLAPEQGPNLPSSIAGLVISSMKEAGRLAYLNANPRIMEAALRVEVSVPGDALGRTYTVLAKRRGRVLCEDMKDGVNVFNVEAELPLTESFGFAEALRKQTSGFASAQMMFCHWEAVGVDPFWAPRTEEELEDLGLADTTEADNNLARKLITSVRRRKGLRLEEKIVENAEKQRTLSKKK